MDTTTASAGNDPVLGTLHSAIDRAVSEFDAIPDDRKRVLEMGAAFVAERRRNGQPAPITFICTHNSRRSHLAQVWAQTAAACRGLDHVKTYSGGTEATACDPRTVAALERAGFSVGQPPGPHRENPVYRIAFSRKAAPLRAFSKVYDEDGNPAEGYAAVLTCSHADENCPVVRGAAVRISLPFRDPKEADGSPEESETYDARCRQIAREMFYLMSRAACLSSGS